MPSVGLGHSGTGVAVEAGGCWVGDGGDIVCVGAAAFAVGSASVGISSVGTGVGSGEHEARTKEARLIPTNRYLPIQFIAQVDFISISEGSIFPQIDYLRNLLFNRRHILLTIFSDNVDRP